MAKIKWTEEAVNWMKKIYDYISIDNPNAALNVINGIYDKVQMLGNFPEMGSIYRKEPEGIIRILLFGHYRIAYLVKSNGTDIEILGIFHGTMDIERYFL
jgi:toxin ParE1/3/4